MTEKDKVIEDADICIRSMYAVLDETVKRCGTENNEFIPSQIVGAMFGAEQWMREKYGHFEDIKEQYFEQISELAEASKTIEVLQSEIKRMREMAQEAIHLIIGRDYKTAIEQLEALKKPEKEGESNLNNGWIFYWKSESPDWIVPYYGPVSKENTVCIEKGNSVPPNPNTIGKTVGELRRLSKGWVCPYCGNDKIVLVAPGIPGIRANPKNIYGPCPICSKPTEGEKLK